MNKHVVNLVQGAIHGLVAWLAYETVEISLSCILPMVISTRWVSSGDWRMLALLFAAYPVVGLLLGAITAVVIGLFRSEMDDFSYRASATLTLVMFGVVHFFADTRMTGSEKIAACVAGLMAIAIVAAIFSEAWRRRTGFLSNAWVASLLLLSAPWISEDLSILSLKVKAALSLGAIAAIAIAAAVLYRMFPPRRKLRFAFPATVAALALSFGVTWLLSARQDVTMGTAEFSRQTPNVVLIVMDTVRADHLSLYGYQRDTSPNLRELARTATVYTRAASTADMTLTSHASLFTGLYPSWHHAVLTPDYPVGRPLDPKFTTLAEVLRNKGFFTSAVVGNTGFLSRVYHLDKGFINYNCTPPVVASDWTRDFYLRQAVQQFLPNVRDSEMPGPRAEMVNSRALASLSQTGGRPFFLFLNYIDSHDPYLPPAPYDSLFPGRDDGLRPGWIRTMTEDYELGKGTFPDAARRHIISQYDGGIAYQDAQIARLITDLKKRGVYDNTMIIVTADHGESLGDHGFIRHCHDSVYQDQVHVPLLIKYPGQHVGRVSADLTSLVDIMPTILDQLGYAPPPGIQGRSLLRPAPANLGVYSEAYTAAVMTANVPARLKWGTKRALFYGQMKLIVSTVGAPELYDLSTDPGETRRVVSAETTEYGALRLQLAAWMKSMPAQARGPVNGANGGSLDNLRTLGYVQ